MTNATTKGHMGGAGWGARSDRAVDVYAHQLELCRFFRDLVARWAPKVRRLRKKRKR